VGLSAGDERERQQQLADSVALEAKDDCYSRTRALVERLERRLAGERNQP
jgi:hypothetical protein